MLACFVLRPTPNIRKSNPKISDRIPQCVYVSTHLPLVLSRPNFSADPHERRRTIWKWESSCLCLQNRRSLSLGFSIALVSSVFSVVTIVAVTSWCWCFGGSGCRRWLGCGSGIIAIVSAGKYVSMSVVIYSGGKEEITYYLP